MGGGQIQLIAKGIQDNILFNNPQITFFKSVYNRHTNFSIECLQINNDDEYSIDEKTINYKVPRYGDLLYKCHLEIDFPNMDVSKTSPAYINYTNNTAHSYVKRIDLEIGNKCIDTHYGKWYDIQNSFNDIHNSEHVLLNKHYNKKIYLENTHTLIDLNLKTFLPFHFWFCHNPGLALPLIALQYHDVNFKITYRGLTDIINSSTTIEGLRNLHNLGTQLLVPPKIKLWANYIYLDTDERRKFAQSSHEYLIEQVQLNEKKFTNNTTLHFNHPVKELKWVIQNDTAIQAGEADVDATLNIKTNTNWTENNDFLNYLSNNNLYQNIVFDHLIYDHFDKCNLILNGVERFSSQSAPYFRALEPYNNEYMIPKLIQYSNKLIYMYSFSLKPKEYQPSGTCNFSKIDSASLNFTGNLSSDHTISVYAVNYNILRIMSGMGGLLFGN